MKTRIFGIAPLVLLVAGCASLGPKFNEHPVTDKSKARVYIYRPSKFAGSAGSPYADIGRKAALGPAGGGALGAAMSSSFFGGEAEQKQILDLLDTRAQKASLNPGFQSVKPDFGSYEIQGTKLFKVPKYEKNHCEVVKK